MKYLPVSVTPLIAAVVAMPLLSGCAGDSARSDAAAPTAGATTATISAGGTPAPASTAGPGERTVWFEFDSAQIRGDAVPVLEAWAKYLDANPKVRIHLEGHCDERGTREYNVALGERRANAVRAFLAGRGVGADQLDVRSLGEESPLDPGHDERAWARNRRVELRE